jgi:three-Cys-motif partner protein
MKDTLPTVWPADPHTIAKHRILDGYLKAWLPIVSRLGKQIGVSEILYVDAFAGPGRYQGGEDGSPIIALNAALSHTLPLPLPVRLLFIEADEDRCAHLSGILDARKAQIAGNSQIRVPPPVHGDCVAVLTEELAQRTRSGTSFGPALVFFDQFGYSTVPMDLISRIMGGDRCEVFMYLNWNRLHPYMTDQTKWESFTRAFGGDEWKEVVALHGMEKQRLFLQSYREALRSRGGARYTWPFAMHGEGDQLLYWLFYCTKSLKGLEEMKKAMWKADDSGSFKFSDGAHPAQLSMFKAATQDWLAEHLHKAHLGKKMRVEEVLEYVLTETPCFQYKGALASLENELRLRPLDPPAERRRGTFPDMAMQVEFVRGPAKQASLAGF